jgi:hypothetical protein
MSMSISKPAPPLIFAVTIFPDLSGATLSVEVHTLASLEKRIIDTIVATREDQPLISGCRFGNRVSSHNSLRHNGNVLGINAVVIDYDQGGPRVVLDVVKRNLMRANISSIVHTTASHRPEATRFRLIAPLSQEYAPAQHLRFVEELNFVLGGTAATESKTLSQGWYLGRVDGVDFEIFVHAAVPLDLHVDLKRRPIDTKQPKTTPLGGANTSNVIPLAAALGPRPADLPSSVAAINNNAWANWPTLFDSLTSGQMNALLAVILQLPDVIAVADQERPEWLRVLFALAYAGHRGATEARELALAWSETSRRRFKSEADFDRDWNSFDANRSGAITIGTLLKQAQDAGFDLGAWVAQLASSAVPANTNVHASGTSGTTAVTRVGRRRLNIAAASPAMPPPGGIPGPTPGSSAGTIVGGSTAGGNAGASGSAAPAGSASAQRSGGGATAGLAGAAQPASNTLIATLRATQSASSSFALPPRFSENELAFRFSAQHATDLVYVHEWSKWMRWEWGRWREDHVVMVFTGARKICAQEAAVALAALPSRTADKVAAAINKASCVAAIERLARHHPPQVRPAEAFDADPLALNGPGTIARL